MTLHHRGGSTTVWGGGGGGGGARLIFMYHIQGRTYENIPGGENVFMIIIFS